MAWVRPVFAVILLTAAFAMLYRLSDEQTSAAVSPQRERHSAGPGPVSPGPCACRPGSVLLKDHVPKDRYHSVSRRREAELRKDRDRTSPELSRRLLAQPNSPLQYPIQGFAVQPLKSSVIPGLALYAREQPSYKVTLSVNKGALSTDSTDNNVLVKGNGAAKLTLQSSSLPLLNAQLGQISYTSTIYHIHTGDIALFSFENYEAQFPIVIRQPRLPVLYDIGTDINSQVTITTKTFLRYDQLRVLLRSIRRFYSEMKVIIADDSIEAEKVPGEYIEQYFMPPAQGWFAGRNLAVSQVTTKYFLWVDDDFEFTESTKIEKLVEVMEAVPELDVLGGSVQGNQFYFSLEYDEGTETEGGCLYRKSGGTFHALPGYPQCTLVSGVVNFFLARTDSIQRVRFDPQLKRVAHSEFFMDGLGSLMVASCKDVSIDHQPKKSSANYNHFRSQTKHDEESKYQLHFFKNNLKCIKFG